MTSSVDSNDLFVPGSPPYPASDPPGQHKQTEAVSPKSQRRLGWSKTYLTIHPGSQAGRNFSAPPSHTRTNEGWQCNEQVDLGCSAMSGVSLMTWTTHLVHLNTTTITPALGSTLAAYGGPKVVAEKSLCGKRSLLLSILNARRNLVRTPPRTSSSALLWQWLVLTLTLVPWVLRIS